MQELERMIKIYHTAFIVFLILTVIFLIVSIVLFFRFNIRGIFDMKTGRGAKRTIQKMQELNAQTGRLRPEAAEYTPSVLAPQERIAAPPETEKKAYDAGQSAGPSAASVMEGAETGEGETAPLKEAGAQETELLSEEQAPETELLSEGQMPETELQEGDGMQETAVLSVNQKEEIQQPEKPALPGAFKIEKEIMWIHTEEML